MTEWKKDRRAWQNDSHKKKKTNMPDDLRSQGHKKLSCKFEHFMLPENILLEHTVTVVSVHLSVGPSLYLLNLLSEIDVGDSKCSLIQGLVEQGLSWSFWKVQGHSEHIKESNFNISSYIKSHSRSLFEKSRSPSTCWLIKKKIPISTIYAGIWSHIMLVSRKCLSHNGH
jgi:hypothetical protein